MPLSQNDLDWFAARLSIAVYDTNAEYRMRAFEDANLPPISFNRTAEKHAMSITGAVSLKAKFDAARARKAELEARAESAVNTYNGAADIAESAIKLLEDDAAALQAEAAQFSNGGPV